MWYCVCVQRQTVTVSETPSLQTTSYHFKQNNGFSLIFSWQMMNSFLIMMAWPGRRHHYTGIYHPHMHWIPCGHSIWYDTVFLLKKRTSKCCTSNLRYNFWDVWHLLVNSYYMLVLKMMDFIIKMMNYMLVAAGFSQFSDWVRYFIIKSTFLLKHVWFYNDISDWISIFHGGASLHKMKILNRQNKKILR